MENPYKRLRKLCGTSQVTFAAKHGVSKMTLIYIEAGAREEVSDRLNMALAAECHDKGVDARQVLSDEYGVGTLNEAYTLWQIAERRKLKEDFAYVRPPFPHTRTKSPFECFVEATYHNPESFGKRMKVNPEHVRRYIKGTVLPMPEDIYTALSDIDYEHTGELQAVNAAWMQEHRA